jgi:hypothetical protein
MAVRDHEAIAFNNLKGLWDRGDLDNVPLDHFTECNNIDFVGNNVVTRPGIELSQDVVGPLQNILRVYNYPTQTANTLIILVENDDGDGEIYHFVNATTIYGPLLTKTGMTDFAFVSYAGRGYISPFDTFITGDLNIQKGLQNEYLYVYNGDGTAARQAAGVTPAGTLTIANGAAGHTDAGFHIFGIVGETDSGFLSGIYAINTFTTVASNSVSFGTVPVLSGAQWTKRHLVATKVITTYNGDPTGYDFFFVPDAIINNNTDLFLNNISFFDADLLEDASHLLDNYTAIPAGANLSIYHERLCLGATYDDISLVLVSAKGEPEAISQIDGLLIVPLDGNPITNHWELRDVFYIMKRARTVAYVDNGQEPSSWEPTIIDNALGTGVHGISTVLDTGAASVDFLIVATFAGLQLFSGKYIVPELTWKIEHLWKSYDRNDWRKIQIVNLPVQKKILVVMPDGRILVGNYANGMDPKNIRWYPWSWPMPINTVAVWNIDTVILGSPLYVPEA